MKECRDSTADIPLKMWFDKFDERARQAEVDEFASESVVADFQYDVPLVACVISPLPSICWQSYVR